MFILTWKHCNDFDFKWKMQIYVSNDTFVNIKGCMEAQVNVCHQLRVLLLDLVNKRANTNTCNKPSTSFYRKYVVRQMIFSTLCIVLKMTYDMRGLTYFLMCEVNIMPFFLLGGQRGMVLRLNIHINVMNYLLVLPLRGKGFNKLRGLEYFWK